MTRRRSFPWLATALVSVCIALVWIAYEQMQASAQAPDLANGSTGSDPSVSALPATPTFTMPPASEFSEIAERPLFSQTRRPPDAAVAVEVAAATIELSLIGVVVSGVNRTAVFSDKSTGDVVRLKRDDRFRGWLLSQIADHGVVFTNNEQEVRLELDFEQAPPPQARKRRNQLTAGQRQQQQQQQQIQRQNQSTTQQLQQTGVLPAEDD